MEDNEAPAAARHGRRRVVVVEENTLAMAGAGAVAEEDQWQQPAPEERLVRVPEEDNAAFLAKIRQRMDR